MSHSQMRDNARLNRRPLLGVLADELCTDCLAEQIVSSLSSAHQLVFSPTEIVDGNVKMTLGMIWTIILRFAIQDISVEGKTRAW